MARPRQNWLRWYRLVRLFRLEGVNSFNRVFVPRAWEQIEKIAPRMTAHDPTFEVIPGRPKSVALVDYVSQWLLYIWEERLLRKDVREWTKGALTYGTGWVKLYMDVQTKKELVERMEIDEETGERIMVEEEVEISALPAFGYVDIFDIDVDPRYSCIEDAPGIIHSLERQSFGDLLSDEKALNYFNLDKIKAMASGATDVAAFDNSKEKKLEARSISTHAGTSSGTKDGQIDLTNLTVREYWGRFSPTDSVDDVEEYVITTVNDSIVIRLERNPYATPDNQDGIRPFEQMVDHDNPGELYGTGEVEPTETLQIALNKIRNHRLDNVDLVLNRMWVYDRNGGVNPKHLQSFPGNVIAADDVNAIQPLVTPDVTSSSYAEEDRIERDFQRATGNIDSTDQGGAGGFINTATGEKIRDKDRSARFQLKIENLEDALARVAQKMLRMLHATEGQSFVIRRRNKNGETKFTEIQKELLREAVEGMAIRVKAGSTISDDYEERRNEALAQWNLASVAHEKGLIDQNQLKDVFENVMRIAFKNQNLTKSEGGGLQSLLAPPPPAQPAVAAPSGTAAQINPQTLTPNGLPPDLAI